MTIIDDKTVVIFTFAELKSVIESENSYNYIYIGENLSMTGGIRVPSTKTKLTIDGNYNDVTITISEKASLSASDTIQITSPSTTFVSVQNLSIKGENYYGLIYVPDNSSYQNITLEYQNITYTGPQIIFNPYGLSRIVNSNITINDTSLTSGNEVAECNKIELGGTTTIIHNSKGNSAFWFRNSTPYLKVLTNSNITFTSQYRELFYGTNDLDFTILSNSSFNITTYNGLAYSTFSTKNTLIDAGSKLTITKTAYSGNYATWYSKGSITVNDNASLIIINDYPSITTTCYNISFTSSSASFTLNNPKEILIFNKQANIINTSTVVPFTFNFSRLNLFSAVPSIESNISVSNIPTYSWYKESTISTVTGTFNSSSTSLTSNNFTEEELSNLPSLTNFIFANKKALSIGTIPLKINAITDTDTAFKGYTTPLASLQISYLETSVIISADETGYFEHSYIDPLPIGTIITFIAKENKSLTYKTKAAQIVYSGEITIDSATEIITFLLNPISKNPLICPKKEAITINITDTRVNKTSWKIYAQILKDLTSPEDDTLANALIFQDENDTITPLSSTKTLIYTEKSPSNINNIVTIPAEEGILLAINETLKGNTEYKTTIIWTLEEE